MPPPHRSFLLEQEAVFESISCSYNFLGVFLPFNPPSLALRKKKNSGQLKFSSLNFVCIMKVYPSKHWYFTSSSRFFEDRMGAWCLVSPHSKVAGSKSTRASHCALFLVVHLHPEHQENLHGSFLTWHLWDTFSMHFLMSSLVWFSQILLLFHLSIMSDSLWPYGLQYARLPCPSLSSEVCSNSPETIQLRRKERQNIIWPKS